MKTVRIGIAGIGYIAEEYIRLISEGRIENLRVCAVSSRNAAHMRAVCEKYALSDAELYTDYDRMLECAEIDAVMICTPHVLHAEMAEKALARGLHVLVEKPVSARIDEAQALVRAAQAHPQLICGVLYCKRTSASFGDLRRRIQSGEFGRLKRVNWMMTCFYRPDVYYAQEWRGSWDKEGGGMLLTQASHHLDALVWLLGMPERVQAFCGFGVERAIETENEALLQMWYPNDLTVQMIASAREYPGTNRLEISGSRAQLVLEGERFARFRRLERDEAEYARSAAEMYASIPYAEEAFEYGGCENAVQQAAIVNNFVRAVNGLEPVLCPIAEAAKSLELINAAYYSAWRAETVHLPLGADAYRTEWMRHASH